MNTLDCNCDGGRVQGVGDFSGILSGIGNWFSSGVGLELVKAGISFGVGYGIHELTGGGGAKPAQPAGNLTGGTTVNPAGSIFIPQAQPIAAAPVAAASAMPEWFLPVALIGGLAVVVLAMKK
jgi:hypothetical protein